MPLTDKGKEIMENMKEEYGPKKGEGVFYASRNAGTIKGVEKDGEPTEDKLLGLSGGNVGLQPVIGPGSHYAKDNHRKRGMSSKDLFK